MGLVVLGCPEEETTTEVTEDCPLPIGSGSEAPDVTLLLSEVADGDDDVGAEVDFMITVLGVVTTLLFTPVTLVTLTAGVGTAGGGVLAFESAVCLLFCC